MEEQVSVQINLGKFQYFMIHLISNLTIDSVISFIYQILNQIGLFFPYHIYPCSLELLYRGILLLNKFCPQYDKKALGIHFCS